MKAITLKGFGGPELMEFTDIETPSPSGDQILIKVKNASVNRPDIIQREGNYPPPPGDSEIMGLEVAGVVESVGQDATRFKPGDRVAAYLPNIPETIIAFLASVSIGAVWSVCAPDMAAPAVIDRFKQIEPKVLIACDAVPYAGRRPARRRTTPAARLECG